MIGLVGSVVRILKQGRIVDGRTTFLLGMVKGKGPFDDATIVSVWDEKGGSENRIFVDCDLEIATKAETENFWDSATLDLFIV